MAFIPDSPKARFFLGLASALLLLIGISIVVQTMDSAPPDDGRVAGTPEDRYEATFTGDVICLPHKDTSGPQTMECAMGLKTTEGFNVALDLAAYQGLAGSGIDTGQHITVHGMFTPIEMLSSDHWQIYDVRGILSVMTVMDDSSSSAADQPAID